MTIRTELLRLKDVHDFNELVRKVILSTEHYPEDYRNGQVTGYVDDGITEDVKFGSNNIHIVCKVNKKVVGFVTGYFEGGTFWLSWIGVDPEYRGKGIGDRLIKYLEKHLEGKTDAHKIWFCTATNNTQAHTLFTRNGYTNIAHLEKHWYKIDIYLWQKFIER